MKLKNILSIVGISALTSVVSVWGYGEYIKKQNAGLQTAGKLPVNYAGFFEKGNGSNTLDFTAASSAATPAVVHIKTKTKERRIQTNQRQVNPFGDMFGGELFDQFFNMPRMQIIPEQRASGSGVLVSDDGYIVTNNHVVEGADEITVTLTNKKTYKGSVIGTDPNSDLAVIKIDGSNFPYLVYGNSDESKLGQWVLAIGYPLNLDVTVTAGIISAKARSIGIIGNGRQQQDPQSATPKAPVEAFIQTDAAVNKGNSGGALINTTGELIGINTAIASETGSYAGYSYAIPVNIVKKVVTDIIKYGTVQRAFIGISYANDNLSEEEKKKQGIKDGDGVFVTDVTDGGAAKMAGIKKGDFITKINGNTVKTGPELQEQIARLKPGDKVSVTYTRDGKENTASVTLKNKIGNTNLVKEEDTFEKLGAELVTVDKKLAQDNDISGGVQVKKINEGALKKAKVQDGFIITAVNGQVVKSKDDLKSILRTVQGNTIFLDGVYPGFAESYRYPVKLKEDQDNE